MEIDYTNSRIDYIVHSTVAAQGRPSRAVFHHYYWVMHWAVMAFLAVYVSFVAGFIFMAGIFYRDVSSVLSAGSPLFARAQIRSRTQLVIQWSEAYSPPNR